MLDQTKRDELGTRYRLRIQTLSPLHVGVGGEDLHRRTPDFLPVDDQLIVIDVDKLSEVLGTSQIERLTAGVSLSTLLDGLRDDQKKALAAYTLPLPDQDVRTIRPHIKLRGARPYLPGSTLKGGLRTALAWCMVVDSEAQVNAQKLNRSRYWASSALEKGLFGRDPKQDLLRAVQIGDSEGLMAPEGLKLAQVAVYSIQRGRHLGPKGSRYRFHLEVIPEDIDFSADGRRDNFVLRPKYADKLDFGSGPAYLSRVPYHVNRFAEALIEQEGEFYRRYGPSSVADFYDQLQDQLDSLDRERTCLLQVAWGTGWTSKTVGSATDTSKLDRVRRLFALGKVKHKACHSKKVVPARSGRGLYCIKCGKVIGFDEVSLYPRFPKTRRLVEQETEAVMPLGWLQVTFEPLDDAWIPELVASAPAEGTPPPVTERLITAVDSAPTEGERPSAQPRTIDDLQEGQIVEGEVEGIAKFGAFVDIGLPFNGLIHISELSEHWVDRVEDVVHRGQKVRVRVIEVDVQRQRVGLSLKQV